MGGKKHNRKLTYIFQLAKEENNLAYYLCANFQGSLYNPKTHRKPREGDLLYHHFSY